MGLSHVDLAVCAKDAISFIKKNVYTYILTDIGLPDIDGFEVIKSIKTDFNNKNVPIVVISAFGRDMIEDQCINLGVDHILTKPISKEKSQQVINLCQHGIIEQINLINNIFEFNKLI